MLNLRFCGGAAATAFILSLIFGIFSGSAVLVIFLRAIIFGGIFFILAAGIDWIVGQYLPELLDVSNAPEDTQDREFSSPGANLDISVDEPVSVGDEQDEEGLEGTLIEVDDISEGETMFPPGIGNEAEAYKPGLDQKKEDGYTTREQDEVKSTGSRAVAAVPDAGSLESVDSLPELNDRGGAFSSREEVSMVQEAFIPESAGPRVVETKRRAPKSPMGDFNPKDIASAIQTVLKREEKG